MNKLLNIVVMAGMVGLARAACDVEAINPVSAREATNYRDNCIDVLSKQVRMEFEASLQYLLMAAQFSQDTYHLPGLAGQFWKSADEERDHGKQFIEYLRMRGYQGNSFFEDGTIKPILNKNSWESASEALRDALEMEKAVTASMKNMIDVCSKDGEDDPHAADWLTATWLEEQLNGQRHLAGLINSLERFNRDHKELGEWLFDKEL